MPINYTIWGVNSQVWHYFIYKRENLIYDAGLFCVFISRLKSRDLGQRLKNYVMNIVWWRIKRNVSRETFLHGIKIRAIQ